MVEEEGRGVVVGGGVWGDIGDGYGRVWRGGRMLGEGEGDEDKNECEDGKVEREGKGREEGTEKGKEEETKRA